MIKAIIFDFDKTVYVGDIGDSNKSNDRFVVEKCFGKGVYEDFVKKYGVDKKDIKDIVEICRKEGRDYKKVAQVFADNLFVHNIKNKLEILPNEFFQKLSKNYALYIASMSQIKYLNHYFSLYDIDRSCFKDLLCMDLINHASKAELFKTVMKRENCKPEETLMIGDNLFHDIKPALKLGMNALHFNGDFSQIYSYLTVNNICDCREFYDKRKLISSKQC